MSPTARSELNFHANNEMVLEALPAVLIFIRPTTDDGRSMQRYVIVLNQWRLGAEKEREKK